MYGSFQDGIAPPFRRDRARVGAPLDPVPSSRGRPGAWRGRPHTDRMMFAVRHLVETTCLTYTEISARLGIGRATICRWKQDEGWVRPAGAPVATDTAPSSRASARLRARQLHRRAQDVAARILDELEQDPEASPEALWSALEMLKAAKLARMPKRRRRPGEPKPEVPSRPNLKPGRLPSPHLPAALDADRARRAEAARPGRGRAGSTP